MKKFPYDFLAASNFEDAGFGGIFLGVGTDYDVAVGKTLCTAGILKAILVDVRVVGVPDHLAAGIEFGDFVTVGEVGVDVAVGQHDCREGPVVYVAPAEFFEVGGDGADDFAGGCVFFHLKGK